MSVYFTEPSREYKSFSRNHRLLYDEEVGAIISKLVNRKADYYQMATMTVIEFIQVLHTFSPIDDEFRIFSGETKQNIVAVLNTFNPQKDEENLLHFITLIFNPHLKKCVIIDPLAADGNGCNEPIKELLFNALDYFSNVNEPNELHTICLDLQQDSYNCGIYAVIFVDKFINSHNDFSIFFNKDTYKNIDIKKERTRFSKMLYMK